MLMSKGKDLNQFQIYAKGGAKVNLLQSSYKHICSTSESESQREMQQQPNEQSYSPVQRRDGGKLGKEEEEQQLNSYGSSELELSYTKNDTSASVLKKGTLSFHFHSCHLICLQTSFTCKSLHSSCYKQCLFGSLFYSITLKKKGF